jgi:hypothetical protein
VGVIDAIKGYGMDLREEVAEIRTDVKWIKAGMEKHFDQHEWWWRLCVGSLLTSLVAMAFSVLK